MAFTGTPVIALVSDSIVRITGVSLESAAAGTIGCHGNASAEVKCPAAFKPAPYDNAEGDTVSMQDSIDVTAKPAAIGVATAIPVAVVKTGTTPANFLATLTNTHGSLATPNLEIYVKFHE